MVILSGDSSQLCLQNFCLSKGDIYNFFVDFGGPVGDTTGLCSKGVKKGEEAKKQKLDNEEFLQFMSL